MKKVTLIITVLCILFCNTNQAQSMKYGVKGSFLLSNVYVEDDGMNKFRPGYGIGGFFQYDVLDVLGVSVEPMFSQKGSNDVDYTLFYNEDSPLFINSNTGEPYDFKTQNLSLSVIELPVLGHFIFDLGGMNARVFAGPTFDFLLKATYIKEKDRTTLSDVETIGEILTEDDVTDRFEYFDFGAMAGVGVDLDLTPLILRIDVSYRHGFTNINNTSSKPGIMSNNFAVTLGIGMGN